MNVTLPKLPVFAFDRLKVIFFGFWLLSFFASAGLISWMETNPTQLHSWVRGIVIIFSWICILMMAFNNKKFDEVKPSRAVAKEEKRKKKIGAIKIPPMRY